MLQRQYTVFLFPSVLLLASYPIRVGTGKSKCGTQGMMPEAAHWSVPIPYLHTPERGHPLGFCAQGISLASP